MDGGLPAVFFWDSRPIYTRTLKLPKSDMDGLTDRNINQALLVRHLMGQMIFNVQNCSAVHPVSSSIRHIPHQSLAP